MKYILSLYSLLFTALINAQTTPRVVTRINDDWKFTKDTLGKATNLQGRLLHWQPVNLPHTWNTDDVMDDVPGYHRAACWYRKSLTIDKQLKGRRLYLYFEGVNQVAQVFVNGKPAGEHIGGYSGFYIEITDFVQYGVANEMLVKADNSHNNNIPPLSADFTFYGGIYRDMWLVAVEPVHFSFNDHGSKGVYISTPSVNKESASVQARTIISNQSGVTQTIKINTTVRNKQGKTVASGSMRATLAPGMDHPVSLQAVKVKQPRLWSPDDPYLYTVVTEIREARSGKLLDQLSNPIGFRWFQFDAAKGFFLNGKSCKLVGTSRHQDYSGMGNAVPDELAIEDIRWIKRMGGNFLRVAHYPQDPSVLAACDSLGVLTSVEIPIVNEITESGTFYNNCIAMQVEMIKQHYNHSSVIMWCYMNEVLLRPHYNNDKPKQKIYFDAITKLAKQLDSVTRKEDPYRYTMIAHHGDYNRYREVGLLDISMIVGWNLYSGWYGANLRDFPAFLDSFHKKHPGTPMMVTEYGADADPRVRSAEPVRFDKSVEYTTKFHQYYLTEMMKRPFVAAAMIWNLADFNSETRTESMPHINNKGLLEWNRTPKDPYYYYQAVLLKTPFIKILGTGSAAGVADSNSHYCTRTVQVVSNLSEPELFINGRTAGKQQVTDGICEWKIPFINGINHIDVRGSKNGKLCVDKASIPFSLQPYNLRNVDTSFRQINILLGANRYFTDAHQQVWIPDKEYSDGSWGYVGGRIFKIPGNGRLPYGTDKNIVGTNDDPVYQTQRVGIEKYRLDVPAGEYELTLHFAELLGGQVKELAYNLSNNNDRIEPNGKRVFDVYVNGRLLLENFDIAGQYGSATAVEKIVKVIVTGNKGIQIDFKTIESEPVLNALQLRRIDNSQLQATNK